MSDTSIQEWDRFLGTLYNDTSKVYLKYGDLVRLANAQTTFEELRDAASDALFKFQDITPG